MFTKGMRVERMSIPVGTPVVQDFSFFRWPAELADVVFDVEVQWCGRAKATAHGFSGAVYFNTEPAHIEPIEDEI